MLKANGSVTITSRKETMAIKTVDRIFLRGQSADLFRAAIKSQATCDPYERRLIGFLKKMNARTPLMILLHLQKAILQPLKIE
jgi:hypothetical protein